MTIIRSNDNQRYGVAATNFRTANRIEKRIFDFKKTMQHPRSLRLQGIKKQGLECF